MSGCDCMDKRERKATTELRNEIYPISTWGVLLEVALQGCPGAYFDNERNTLSGVCD